MKLQNNQYLKETLLIKKRLESSFFELAERLKKIRDERIYQDGGFNTFAEFCFEMKMAESTASRLIAVYQRYCLELGMDKEKLSIVGWTQLYSMLPLAVSKEKTEELVEEAQHLRRDDVSKMVKERKNPELAKCEHSRTYLLRICEDCGDKYRVYDN